MDEHEPHRFLLAKNSVAFFRISKSMSTRLCSRRKRVNSSRSSVVSAPAGPSPASILARCTHSRSAASPMLRSDAMRQIVRSPIWQSPAPSALNSGVKERRARRGPIRCFVHETLSLRAFSPIWVSTKSGQVQSEFLSICHSIDQSPPAWMARSLPILQSQSNGHGRGTVRGRNGLTGSRRVIARSRVSIWDGRERFGWSSVVREN